MNKRVNDVRRVILALCFFGLILSLIGTELPWVQIKQSHPKNNIYVISKSTCTNTTYTTTTITPSQSGGGKTTPIPPGPPQISTLTFYTRYFALFS